MKIDILEDPKYPVRNSKHSAQNRYPVPKHVGEYLSGITPKHVATLSVKPIFKDSHDEWYVSKELMEWLLMHPSESHSIYFGQPA